MNDESAVNVSWECGDLKCQDLQDCLNNLEKVDEDDAIILCNRKDGYLAAEPGEDHTFHCSVSLPSTSGSNDLFLDTHAVSLEELTSLFSRYAQGEDFAWVRGKWEDVQLIKKAVKWAKLKGALIAILCLMIGILLLILRFIDR